MLLNEQQIEEDKKRAEEVVNGFTTIKMQQARDALSLAETIQLRNKQLANLVEEIKTTLKADLKKRVQALLDEANAAGLEVTVTAKASAPGK